MLNHITNKDAMKVKLKKLIVKKKHAYADLEIDVNGFDFVLKGCRIDKLKDKNIIAHTPMLRTEDKRKKIYTTFIAGKNYYKPLREKICEEIKKKYDPKKWEEGKNYLSFLHKDQPIA